MSGFWDDLIERIKALAGSWAAYTALGSFALYLLGYLSLRFHLATLGVGTDVTSLVDERYLFTGARFVIYLCSSVPIILLLLLGLSVLFMGLSVLSYLPYKLLRRKHQTNFKGFVSAAWKHLLRWWLYPQAQLRAWATPNTLSLVGVICSVLMIQFLMRQCFYLINLTLDPDPSLPGTWLGLETLVLSDDSGLLSLYFSGLVGGTALTGLLLFSARFRGTRGRKSNFLLTVLTFLVIVQFLMLPVNYGILIVDKRMPRVADLGGQEILKEGEEAWLIWEGSEGVTYLVKGQNPSTNNRALITLPHKEVKRMAIVGYDPLTCLRATCKR